MILSTIKNSKTTISNPASIQINFNHSHVTKDFLFGKLFQNFEANSFPFWTTSPSFSLTLARTLYNI